jgi:hypothetical protein
MKSLFLLFILLVSAHQAYSQSLSVYGTVQNEQGKTTLPGAQVLLIRSADSVITAAVTDAEGRFRFERVAPGAYKVDVKYLGFKPFSRAIRVELTPVDLGILSLQEDVTVIQEVQVVGRVPLGQQKGDTTQYNAGAFKTTPDASADDLVQKMPGVTIQNGRVQAQGEDVARILIDGKRFFGDDADAALRNLPADVVESVQIFDKQSDRAEVTGFDDGNREKTINIVTKPNRRKGQFGKISAGYGTDDRYMVGAAVNFFDGDRRITLTGLSNNINMLDFSVGETPGGGMRGRRGWRGGGSPNGIINTNTFGINYSDMWGEKMEVSGSYFFNRREIANDQYRFRDFVLANDSGQVYTEDSRSTTFDTNHQFNLRMDYKINERNRLIITPRLSAQQNDGVSYFLGRTVTDNGPINQTTNNFTSESFNLNFDNDIHYSHQFAKQGRSFSTSLNTSYSASNGDSYRLSENIFYTRPDRNNLLDQYTRQDRTGYAWEGEVSFTEPVGQNGQVELEYEIGNRVNDSDRRTYNRGEQTGTYTLLDTLLTNTFRSEYLTQGVELGYQYSVEKYRFQVEAEYQRAQLQNDQEFPRPFDMDRVFYNVLPSARFEYKWSKNKNLNIDYRMDADAPSISQLQDVIDNRNPLQLRTGNPALDQSFENRFRMRYRAFQPDRNKTFFAGIFGGFTQNFIGNSTLIAEQPIELSDEIILERGSQLTRPVNLDGYWNVRSFFSYGQPLTFMESNVNVRGSVGYTRIPGLINDRLNYSNATNFGVGLTLSSNISEKVDFTLSSNSNYNVVENTLRPNLNNNFFNQNTSLRFNWIFWKGLVYRTELNHQLYTGLSEGYNQDYLLWNMSISKKVLDNKGEISLSVNDLLKQNISIQRNITELYVEDVQSMVLQRYFMLTFTWNIRNFAGGKMPEDMERENRDGPGRNYRDGGRPGRF